MVFVTQYRREVFKGHHRRLARNLRQRLRRLPYVIADIRAASRLPLAAYQVSGEYAMIKFGALAGAIDEGRVVRESIGAIKRAGADLILSYFAMDLVREGI